MPRWYLPKSAVRYPFCCKTRGQVTADAGKPIPDAPSSGERKSVMPTCEPYRPVRNATRLGEQTGVVTKALLNLTPSRASRSMFGVIDFAVAVRANGPERLIVGDNRDEVDFEVGGSLSWRLRLRVDLAVLPPHLLGHRLHALGFAGRQIALFARIVFQVVEFVFGKVRVGQQLPIARAQGDFGHRQVVVRSGDGMVVLPIERRGAIGAAAPATTGAG